VTYPDMDDQGRARIQASSFKVSCARITVGSGVHAVFTRDKYKELNASDFNLGLERGPGRCSTEHHSYFNDHMYPLASLKCSIGCA